MNNFFLNQLCFILYSFAAHRFVIISYLLLFFFSFFTQNNPPTIVRERVLGLIQYWVDAFKDKPQLYAVANLYGQLKEDGVEFPPLDLDSLTPVDTPDRVRMHSLT